MLFHAERINAEYRVEFSPPLFSLVTRIGLLLEALHTNLSSRFAIPLSNLSALPGPSVGEVGARVTLFEGLVHVDVTPGYFAVTAERMVSADDIAKVTDCIETALRVIASFAETHNDKAQAQIAKLSTKVWLVGPDDVAINPMLGKLLSPSISEKFKDLKVSASPHFNMQSGEFEADILVQQSVLRNNGVYVNIEISAIRGSATFALPTMVNMVRKILADTLSLVDIQLPEAK